MKWDINLQNIQDEYTMLTPIFILIMAISVWKLSPILDQKVLVN